MNWIIALGFVLSIVALVWCVRDLRALWTGYLASPFHKVWHIALVLFLVYATLATGRALLVATRFPYFDP